MCIQEVRNKIYHLALGGKLEISVVILKDTHAHIFQFSDTLVMSLFTEL